MSEIEHGSSTPEHVHGGNDEFPIAFAKFAATLRGTKDSVYTLLMKNKHGRENHTLSEWRQLLEGKRSLPAHPHGGAR